MYRTSYRVVALLALVWWWCVYGQITFSRDWAGGKRAPAARDPPPAQHRCHRYIRICSQFIHELRAAMSAARARRGPDPEHTTYYEDKIK